jgi:hypothetical protein
MYTSNQDQHMTRSRFPAGSLWPVFLVCIAVLVSGCITGNEERGAALSAATPVIPQTPLTTPLPDEIAGNDTGTSSLSHELSRGVQGFVARPVNALGKSIRRQTTIAVAGTSTPLSYQSSPLNATGSDVNMSDVTIQTETIPPV